MGHEAAAPGSSVLGRAVEEVRSALNEHADVVADLFGRVSSEVRTGFAPAVDSFVGFFHAVEAVGVVRRRVATGRRARRGGRVLRRAGLPLVMHCCLTAPPTSASSDPSRYPFLCDLSPPLCSGPCFIESVGALPFPHVI
uniref:Uncharacterized protein n=1 Tax=Zea mays TaxID=4577 RepID=B6TAN8_MAIZE|nr:hypothetical protein [Zea mays]